MGHSKDGFCDRRGNSKKETGNVYPRKGHWEQDISLQIYKDCSVEERRSILVLCDIQRLRQDKAMKTRVNHIQAQTKYRPCCPNIYPWPLDSMGSTVLELLSSHCPTALPPIHYRSPTVILPIPQTHQPDLSIMFLLVLLSDFPQTCPWLAFYH